MARFCTVTSARLGLVLLVICAGRDAAAQTILGPVPWQMLPYCNVVTLTLTNTPAGFRLDGTEDQCGAVKKASVVGIASPNADGNFTMNFSIVTPWAKAVHVSAVVSPATGHGTWLDSIGHGGTFAFFQIVAGLPVRPLPPSSVAPGTITQVELAGGSVGATEVLASQVQLRVSGACGAGSAISAVLTSGGVTCVPIRADVRFRSASLADQTLGPGTTSITGWGSLTNVGAGSYDPATGEYSVPSAGTYMVSAAVGLLPNGGAPGNRCVVIFLNGVAEVGECQDAAAVFESQSATAVLALAAGDVVGVRILNNTGASFTASDGAVTGFYVARLH